MIKNLGEIEHKEPVTPEELKKLIGTGDDGFTFDFRVDVQDILDAVEGHSIPIEGLNAKADEIFEGFCPKIGGSISDISYSFKRGNLPAGVVYINVNCSASELEWPDEEAEKEEAEAIEDKDRRRGLYGPEYKGEKF